MKAITKSFSQILIAVVLTAIVVGGGVYYYQKRKVVTGEEKFKEYDFSETGYDILPVRFEVPVSWSVFRSTLNVDELGKDSDTRFLKLPQRPTLSIARNYIVHDFSNSEQVNLYFSHEDMKDRLIEQVRKSGDEISWAKEMVGGIPADVESNASNGYPGNKTYYLSLPGPFLYSFKTVVIQQQASPGKDFEDGLKHFIETIVFKNL